MSEIIRVDIIDNGTGGHDDLIVSIDGLVTLTLDAYYFVVEIGPYNDIRNIRNAVATLLSYWLTEMQNAKEGQPLFLPIDFSDEYIGCLSVIKQEDILHLTYGFSGRHGYTVNPLNPMDFATTTTDFEDTENRAVNVAYKDFVNALRDQINRLSESRETTSN